jgi:hypothetical protein
MAPFRSLLIFGVCLLMLMFAAGESCPFLDSPADTHDQTTGDGSTNDGNGTTTDPSDDGDSGGTDSGPTITVQFEVSAKVVTSIGSGVDGETVNFQGDKFYWNDHEEEWEFRRTASASRTTNSAGGPGTTDAWYFGYDLHPGEKVFISATEQATAQKKEVTYSYTQATAAAAGGTTANYSYQFTLDSGI